ncbi:MAG TPA: hypothetical protein VMT79_15515 [Candidatus Binatia bacterium]|nr:hypothetical protein [Candidatus Binatia bacterium]
MSPSLGPQMGNRSPDLPTLLRRAADDIARGTAKTRIAGSAAHGSRLAPLILTSNRQQRHERALQGAME